MIDIKAGLITDSNGSPLVSAKTLLSDCSTKKFDEGVKFQSNPFVPEITYVHGLRATMQGKEFGVVLTFMKNQLQKITLILDGGPASTRSWENIDRAALKREFDLITSVVTEEVGRPPSRKRPLLSEWRFAWGTAKVSAETKSFSCALYLSFLEPEKGAG